MTTEEKIELFFYDPKKNHIQYREYLKSLDLEPRWKQIIKSHCIFSPLYLLRRDIRHCFGMFPEYKSIKDKLNTTDFAAVLLLRVALTNTVKNLFFTDFSKFAKDYMEIENTDDIEGINLLRNSLEHNFYSLYTIDKKTGSRVTFQLGGFDLIVKKSNGIPSNIEYLVNPQRLYNSYERAVEKLKTKLLDQKEFRLRLNFLKFYNVCGWVKLDID